MNKAKELGKKQKWNHYYNFDGFVTMEIGESSGFCLKKWQRIERIIKNIDIKDKSVIDIGSSDGFFCLKMAEMGAKSVLGVEPDKNRIEKSNYAKEYFKFNNIEFENLSIYDEKILQKRYEISMALGLLHRSPDIYRTLAIISKISDITILEFKTIDDERPICIWGGGQVKLNKWNKLYCIPSINFVKEVLKDLGFVDFYIEKDDSKLKFRRTVMIAKKGK